MRPDPSPIACALALRAAVAQKVYAAVAHELEVAQARRDAAVLHALEAPGMSYGRLAKVVGVPRGTVQSIARRVREAGEVTER